MDRNNLTLADVVLALAPLVALVAGLWLLARGSNVWAALLLAPAAAVYVYSFAKLPFREIGRIAHERETRQRQTAFGRVWVAVERVSNVLALVVLLFLGVLIVAAVYDSVVGGGS